MSVKEALCIVSKVFEGNKKDLREFIENVDAAFELVKPEEHETLLKFVKAKITGEARSRLQVRERTGTWQEVKHVLEENYASKRTIDYYACKIFQARQGQGEPIAMWASRIDEMQRDFREAVNRVTARENLKGAIELVDSLGRACFIQGLSNDRIQTIVRSRGDEITLTAAVELALQEESAILSMRERGLAPRVGNDFASDPDAKAGVRSDAVAANFTLAAYVIDDDHIQRVHEQLPTFRVAREEGDVIEQITEEEVAVQLRSLNSKKLRQVSLKRNSGVSGGQSGQWQRQPAARRESCTGRGCSAAGEPTSSLQPAATAVCCCVALINAGGCGCGEGAGPGGLSH
ncbi:uncharacterized protein LOC124788904 [Schistocerca piceifrons]|uniref:uncharacterized protein LOC124788904 n=1 Tax=Schistocerca piceifrons TaxID=274613 RepID=UPI001F5E85DD|nr:uncharacterized protein LOC124788904 [Schistocerca piceifrons]